MATTKKGISSVFNLAATSDEDAEEVQRKSRKGLSEILPESKKGLSGVLQKPDVSLEALQQLLPPPREQIGFPTRAEIEASHPGFLSLLFGTAAGKNAIRETAPMRNELLDIAEKAEAEGGFLNESRAAGARELVNQLDFGSMAFNILDVEARPRKLLSALVKLEADYKRKKVANPKGEHKRATWTEMKEAVRDEWASPELGSGLVRGLAMNTFPKASYSYDKLLERYPRIGRAFTAGEAMVELGAAIVAEGIIGSGLRRGAKIASKGIKDVTQLTPYIRKARVGDLAEDVMAETLQKVLNDTDDDMLSGLVKVLQDPDAGEAYRVRQLDLPGATSIIPGARNTADVLQGIGYRRYISDATWTKDNPSGWVAMKHRENIIRKRTNPILTSSVTEEAKTIIGDLPSDIMFHGSPEGSLEFIDPTLHTQVWKEGVGFYATSNLDKAKGYAGGRTAKGARKVDAATQGGITYVRNLAKKELDMDAPFNPKLWNEITERAGLGADYIDTYMTPFAGKPKTNQAAFRYLQDIWRDELGEEGIYAINDYLVDMGYGATKHTEGAGDTVRIFIDPDAVEVVNPATLPIKEIPAKTISGRITPKTKISQLTLDELRDVAHELGMIGRIPKEMRDGAFARFTNYALAPPVRAFDRYGLLPQWSDVADGEYIKKIHRTEKVKFLDEVMVSAEQVTGIKWNDSLNEAVARVAAGNSVEKWPAELLDELGIIISDGKITQGQEVLKWMQDVTDTNAELFIHYWRDLGIEQGKLTYDKELGELFVKTKGAEGVAPVIEPYHRRVHQSYEDLIEEQMEMVSKYGEDVKIVEEDILNEIKRKRRRTTPQKADSSIIKPRDESIDADDIVYDFIGNEMLYERLAGAKFITEPRLQKMKATIDALRIPKESKDILMHRFNNLAADAFGLRHPVDTALNSVVNPMSRYVGKHIKKWEATDRAAENLMKDLSKAVDRGVMAAKPRLGVRNLFQSQHDNALLNLRSSGYGWQIYMTQGGKKLRKTSKALAGRGVAIAGLDLDDPTVWRRLKKLDEVATYGSIKASDMINVGHSYLAGWHYLLENGDPRIMQELIDYGIDIGKLRKGAKLQGDNLADVLADALNAGKFQAERKFIDFVLVPNTQWMYDQIGMTPSLRSRFGKTGLKYSSWQQNALGTYIPAVGRETFKGYDVFGNYYRKRQIMRYTAAIGLATKAAVLYGAADEIGINPKHLLVTGAIEPSYLFGRQFPLFVSPAAGAVAGIFSMAIGVGTQIPKALATMSWGALVDNNRMLDEGIKQFLRSAGTHVPYSGAARDIYQVKTGEMSPLGFVLPVQRKKLTYTGKTFVPVVEGKKSLILEGLFKKKW